MMECTNKFQKMLEKNSNFDFLKNLSLPKNSFSYFQKCLNQLYSSHLDAYHVFPLKKKKFEELNAFLTNIKLKNVVFFNQNKNYFLPIFYYCHSK